MKLKTKLSLISLLGMALAVCVTTLIIVTFTHQNTVNDIVSDGLADLNTDVESLNNDAQLKNTTEATYLSYVADTLSSEYAVYLGDAIISNDTGIDPVVALETYGVEDDYSGYYANFSVDGQSYFVARNGIYINSNLYHLFLVKNTTAQMQEVSNLALLCILSGLFVVIVTGIIVYFLTRRATNPLTKLEMSARNMAQGEYSQKIEITGRDEVATLARSFNVMAESVADKIAELNEESARKQDFINGFSHELKTPVTSIMARAQTLLVRDISPEDMKRSLDGIYRQCVWMEQISSKLTSLVLLQKGIEKSSCDVRNLLKEVRESVSGDVMIHCEIDMIEMDADLMRTALVNLVTNSFKAGASTVAITAIYNKICVDDDGCGIDADKIDKLTQPFYTADESRSKKTGGLGLGLSIVQNIVDAHGWNLSIKSEVGVGTSVIITF